jgi:hypothetical protein
MERIPWSFLSLEVGGICGVAVINQAWAWRAAARICEPPDEVLKK